MGIAPSVFAAAQQRSRARANIWRNGDAFRHAQAAFSALAPDNPAAAADKAEMLLADDAWITELIVPLTKELRDDPWFEPPWRANRDPLRIGALLFDHPFVTISASVMSADSLATLPPPSSVVVPGRLAVFRYWRGGGARLRLWRASPAGENFSSANEPPCVPLPAIALSDGLTLRIDGRTHGQLIDQASSDIVTITATMRSGMAPFMREYAIDDGALLKVAALDDRTSRAQMLLALLRHAGRVDAGDCLEAASHDPAYFVRWAAMREWLALDAVSALPRLREMADDPNPEVRAAAEQTLRQLDRGLPL